jgi:hypothetical protein
MSEIKRHGFSIKRKSTARVDGISVHFRAESHPPFQANSPEHANLDFTHSAPFALELTQLTGAICPGDDEVYRPGLWIVVRDTHAKSKTTLPAATQERITAIAAELVKRLQLA